MGIKYGDWTREFYSKATADYMQEYANRYRWQYAGVDPGTDEHRDLVASAAYCQSLADRKREAN